jgi:hypothetical protein
MSKDNIIHIYDAMIQKELYERNYFYFDLEIKDNKVKLVLHRGSIPSKRLESVYFKTNYSKNEVEYETYELYSVTEFNNALEDLFSYVLSLDLLINNDAVITM